MSAHRQSKGDSRGNAQGVKRRSREACGIVNWQLFSQSMTSMNKSGRDKREVTCHCQCDCRG